MREASPFAACSGPGYESPRTAILRGPREKLLYVIGVNTDSEKADVLCTVDVDPNSPTYCQVRTIANSLLELVLEPHTHEA